MKKWTVESLSLAGVAIVSALAAGIAFIEVKIDVRPSPVQLVLVGALAAFSTLMLLLVRSVTIARNAQLRHSQRRYHHLVDTAHEGIWQLDLQANCTFANQRLAHMLGCGVAELQGRSIYDFLAENPRDTLGAILAGERASGLTHDLCYRRADGAYGWAIVNGGAILDDDGQPSGTLLMLTDITARKTAELQLSAIQTSLEVRIKLRTAELMRSNELLRMEIDRRQAAQRALLVSEQRLQEIVAAMPIALILKDPESRIILLNKSAERQSGLPFPEVLGTTASAWYPPDQVAGFLAADKAVFAGRELVVGEHQVWNCVTNENRLLQTFKKPIFDADDKPHYLICMYLDITDRKRAETALQHSFLQLRQLTEHLETIKDQDRKRIALDIHDDLGQNLMALKIDVEMLHTRTGERHPRLNRQVGRVLNTLDATIRSVRAIINDLHPTTLELGLPAALEWLLGQFEKRSGIASTLTVVGGDGAAPDSRRTPAIFRIVQESLLNILRHAEATQVEVTVNMTPEMLAITIADDGIGLHPDDGAKEAGFGLRSIRARIDAFGGELALDCRRGKGTTLSILIPVASSADATARLE
jgi:two-component system sensor histidine kinase UhpB